MTWVYLCKNCEFYTLDHVKRNKHQEQTNHDFLFIKTSTETETVKGR